MGDISNWTSPIIGDPTKRHKKLIEDVDRADLIKKLQKRRKFPRTTKRKKGPRQ